MKKLLEKRHKKFEEKYCAKYGREKYLKVTANSFRLYLILTITWGVFAITQLLLFVASYGDDTAMSVLYFTGVCCGIASSVLWGLQLTFLKAKSKECKEELMQATKPE